MEWAVPILVNNEISFAIGKLERTQKEFHKDS